MQRDRGRPTRLTPPGLYLGMYLGRLASPRPSTSIYLMPIETSVDGDLVTFRVTGSVKSEQIIAAVRGHFARTPTRLALWDFREAILSPINANEFDAMTETAVSFAEVRGPDPRAAIVARRGGDALLAKAYEAHAEARSRITTRFFSDLDAARAWLRTPSER